ncbi:glycosyltransferase family 2 protein [Saccharothrix sp. NRRL B-16314]|uniref:glycosyltransferase family 2 protein n=1 Tax=Saccharothrix sp. NRRL B-16314 TaxID=1463825 RepID=UPI000526D753|nr:glycosyltransferase family 2 protein [Saccharothrix sp. NRRL B-16314]
MDGIDIMLPHYGDSAYLKTAVNSVIAQDDDDWHLTVVDDTDTDDDTLRDWFRSLHDHRVHYQRNDHNLGINGNFQKCLALAERDWLVIMGSDDALLPGYISTIRRTARHFPHADVIQPGVEVIDSADRVVRPLTDRVKRSLYAPSATPARTMSGEDLVVSLLRGNWTYFPSLCWRRTSLKGLGFRPGLAVVLDLALMLDLLERGGQLAVVPDVCFRYRRHDASVSSSLASHGRRFTEERDFFLGVADHMTAIGWHRAAQAARRHLSSRLHALLLLPGTITSGHRASAKALARHAFGTTKPVRK